MRFVHANHCEQGILNPAVMTTRSLAPLPSPRATGPLHVYGWDRHFRITQRGPVQNMTFVIHHISHSV